MTHNSHNRNNSGGHKDSLKNDLAVFTGFKSALEACYLDWEEYTLPGITYTAGSNPMYHCPFTCFRHAGDTRTEVNQVGRVRLIRRKIRFFENTLIFFPWDDAGELERSSVELSTTRVSPPRKTTVEFRPGGVQLARDPAKGSRNVVEERRWRRESE